VACGNEEGFVQLSTVHDRHHVEERVELRRSAYLPSDRGWGGVGRGSHAKPQTATCNAKGEDRSANGTNLPSVGHGMGIVGEGSHTKPQPQRAMRRERTEVRTVQSYLLSDMGWGVVKRGSSASLRNKASFLRTASDHLRHLCSTYELPPVNS
jgi:hypothetical protein